MTPVRPFDVNSASVAEIQEAADECRDVACGIMYLHDRGMFTDGFARVRALEVVSELMQTRQALGQRVKLAESKAINKELV